LHAENLAAGITRKKVTKFLKGLFPSKSMGTDGVHPSVLRYCEEAFAPLLVYILELSITKGREPDQ